MVGVILEVVGYALLFGWVVVVARGMMRPPEPKPRPARRRASSPRVCVFQRRRGGRLLRYMV